MAKKKPTTRGKKQAEADRLTGVYDLAIVLSLVLMTLFCFWQVRHFGFIEYDDSGIVNDTRIQAGLTAKGVLSVLTDLETHHLWLPLSLISHMVDVELFGMENPGWHHLVNVLLHAASVLALYAFLRTVTRSLWPSAVVALLFAIHPVNVEPVAWIISRKDLLAALFFMLALLAYAHYVRKLSFGWYMMVLLAFALSLASKAMFVTLPCVLLLLDYWPLGRLGRVERLRETDWRRVGRLAVEKLPLFALSLACTLLAVTADPGHSSGQSIAGSSLPVRLANAAIGYSTYIGKFLYPRGLAPIYPYVPEPLFSVKSAAAVLFLCAVTLFVLWSWRRFPFLLVGWLWFLGILFPVMGVVEQSSVHLISDKYAYVPCIGLFVLVAWAIDEATRNRRARKTVLGLVSGGTVAALTVVTLFQVLHWQSSEALMRHTLAVTSENAVAHKYLGDALLDRREPREAATQFREALRIQPDYLGAINDLGLASLQLGHYEEAVPLFERAIALAPGRWQPHRNLALALAELGQLKRAASHCEKVLRAVPNHQGARDQLEDINRRLSQQAAESAP
jgi:protein O-mannosyl-transferase